MLAPMSEATHAEQPQPQSASPAETMAAAGPAKTMAAAGPAETMAAASLLVLFLYLIVLVLSQRGGSLSSVSGVATGLLGAITNPSSKVVVPRLKIFQRQLNVWTILVGAGVLSTVVAAACLFPAGYGAAGGAFVAAGAGLAGLLADTSAAAAALRAVSRGRL
jgi:hypothetical protein